MISETEAYINSFLSDQKVDLAVYGIPGHILTIGRDVYSMEWGRLLQVNPATRRFYEYGSGGISHNVDLLWRMRWGNYIALVKPEDKKCLDFLGYPDYDVTRDGRIWSRRHYKWMGFGTQPKGYLNIGLSNLQGRVSFQAHRLVAMAFIPNPFNKPEVNHKDGVKTNNNAWNLEWMDSHENTKHAYDNKLITSRTRMTDVQAHEVCRRLVEGDRNKDIAEDLNIHVDDVCHIKGGRTFKHVSQNYDFESTKSPRQPWTDEQVREICSLLERGVKGHKIVEQFGGTISMVSAIKIGKTYKHISKDYSL